MKKVRNKKIILVLVLLLGIAATFAYYTTTDSFQNQFRTSKYGAKAEEVFESPTNWKPGDETPKTLTVTNTGNTCENVRVSYTEKWESRGGNPLPLVDEDIDENVAIINFDHTNDWKKNGNYYYYHKNLQANETTTSFLKSVTFNPNYQGKLTCSKATEGNKTVETCNPTADSYEGGTYTLTITVETIQCDGMEEEWGVTIDDINQKAYEIVSGDLDTIGSVVKIADEEFYVIGKENDNIKLVAKWNLKVGNIYEEITKIGEYTSSDEGYGLQDENMKGIQFLENSTEDFERMRYGTVAFSTTKYWEEDDYVYNSNSSISSYIESYVDYLNSQGVSVTGRLMRKGELESLSGPVLEVVFNASYWLGDSLSELVAGVYDECYVEMRYDDDETYGVRPVILLEP